MIRATCRRALTIVFLNGEVKMLPSTGNKGRTEIQKKIDSLHVILQLYSFGQPDAKRLFELVIEIDSIISKIKFKDTLCQK